MQTQRLPAQLDVRKLTASEAEIRVSEPVKTFSRFAGLLEDDNGSVECHLRFYRDEQGFQRFDANLDTEVSVLCQRCVQSMPVKLEAAFQLALIWGEEQAQNVPKELDPIVIEAEQLDVLPLLEDELLISLPIVSFHEDENCAGGTPLNPSTDELEVEVGEAKSNPFAVLQTLKEAGPDSEE